MEEERSFITPTVSDNDPRLQINELAIASCTNDFCLFCEDDIEMKDNGEDVSRNVHLHSDFSTADSITSSCSSTNKADTCLSIDVETMKSKAEEIANSLRKVRSSKVVDSDVRCEAYEPPEELKHYREKSLYVAQKLREDRLLFEESKKRSEAVVDKVRKVKRINKNISESARELKKDGTLTDETAALRLKVERLEASLSHLQKNLTEKNQVILEKNETIRTLNESMISTNGAYLNSLEHSKEEIQQLKEEQSKAITRITTTRDELCNQLQTVRKKCLSLENDVKLSEFARCRLVSCNSELREKLTALEQLSSPADFKADVRRLRLSLDKSDIYVENLRPKVENIVTIVNGFRSYLTETCNNDTEDIDTPDLEDECDLLHNLDKIVDRLESTFYIVRDRLSSLTDLQKNAKQMEAKLKTLQAANEESKTQEAKLKKLLATSKAKMQAEVNSSKELNERLLEAETALTDQEWPKKYEKLEFENKQLRSELDKLSSLQSVDRLNEKILQLQADLDERSNECKHLRRTCEQLEDSNDKLENDFVVLQKRDYEEEDNWKRCCSQLQEENVKLLENIGILSDKAMEYENEKLALYKHIEESESLKQTVTDLNKQLIEAHQLNMVLHASKMEYENEMREELDIFKLEKEKLEEQLFHEISCTKNLKEQIQLTENTISEMSKEVDKLHFCLTQENNKARQEFHDERIKLEQLLQQAQASITNYQRNLDEMNVELHNLRTQNIDLQRVNEHLQSDGGDNCNRELEHRIRDLEEECGLLVDKCKEYETKLSNESRNGQVVKVLNAKLRLIEQENQQLMDKCMQYSTNMELLKESRDQQEVRIKFLENENMQMRSLSVDYECKMQLENENRKLINDFEKLKLKYQRLQVYCKANMNKGTSDTITDNELEEWKRKCSELKNQAAPLEAKVKELRATVAHLENVEHNFNELKDKVAPLEAEMNDLRATVAHLKDAEREINEFKYNVSPLEAELKELREKVANFESNDKSNKDNLFEEVNQMRLTIANLEHAELALFENQVTPLQGEVNRFKKVVSDLEYRASDAEQALQNARDHMEKMKTRELFLEHQNLKLLKDCNQYRCKVAELNEIRERGTMTANEAILLVDQLESITLPGGAIQEAYERGCRDETTRQEYFVANLNNELDRAYQELRVQAEKAQMKYDMTVTEMRSDLDVVKDRLDQAYRSLQQRDQAIAEYRARLDSSKEKEVESSGKKSPTLIKYFAKISKNVADILQPEEHTVDYSNWILPEKRDLEYQIRHQQVPEFESQVWPENKPMEKSDSFVQTEDEHLQPNLESIFNQLSIFSIVDQLRNLFLSKLNNDQWGLEKFQWFSSELDVGHVNFVDVSFKFVDLFDAVVKYYSVLPGTEIVLNKFKSFTQNCDEKKVETYAQLVTLISYLECENKYLLDAIGFIEDVILSRQQNVELVRFETVDQSWQVNNYQDLNDVVDRVCEEYDIVPNKFAAGELFTTWKEIIAKLLQPVVNLITTESRSPVVPQLESLLVTVMQKIHKLIGDLYYKYKPGTEFDPNEFFEQVNDVNRDVERLVKIVRGEETQDMSEDVHEHDRFEHKHDHHHKHGHHGHHDDKHHGHDQHHHEHTPHYQEHKSLHNNLQNKTEIIELKFMLSESNKKIDTLVRELVGIKNSREYNEVQQIYGKLDETLYQLHLRDVHVYELTQELTQLMSERDALQLKLSSIIRQNEQLREAYLLSSSPENVGLTQSDLRNKLKQLDKVDYMKDPRIKEASKQYRATELQLFTEDQHESSQKDADENSTGFIVPSIFKWLTGDSDSK